MPVKNKILAVGLGIGVGVAAGAAYMYLQKDAKAALDPRSTKDSIKETEPVIEMEDISTPNHVIGVDDSLDESLVGNMGQLTVDDTKQLALDAIERAAQALAGTNDDVSEATEDTASVTTSSPKHATEDDYQEEDDDVDTYPSGKNERKVLVLGLDRSGKSSILSQLSRENVIDEEYIATKGFNVVCISSEEVQLSIWEIGGAIDYRSYWANFLKDTNVLAYVVDSSNEERLQESREYFLSIISQLPTNIPILFILTKTDLPHATTDDEARFLFDIDSLAHDVTMVSVHVREQSEDSLNGIKNLHHLCQTL